MDAMQADASVPISAHRFFDGRSVVDLCREVFGIPPSGIQPLGEGSNNCGAFKLRVKNQKIKCYECPSVERARLTEQATRILLDEDVPIPHILGVVDHVVFAQWISGKPLPESGARAMRQRMASYQARIHQAITSISDTSAHRFIHLDWLLERLANATRDLVCTDHIQALEQSLRQLMPPGLKPGIVQPDFIKSNLVVTNNGELFMVDNELLSVGLGFEFDILNTSYVTCEGDEAERRRYLDAYAEFGDLGTLDEHETFWEICYLAKMAGKRFLREDVAMGRVCLDLLDTKLQACARGES